MGTFRIFTGEDDKTTWEEIDLAAVKSWTEGMGADEITQPRPTAETLCRGDKICQGQYSFENLFGSAV